MTINVITNDVANLASSSAPSVLNANFAAITAGLTKALNKEGGIGNPMEADIDMDGNDLLNVNTINGKDITSIVSVAVGTTTTLDVGLDATVTNSGNNTEAVLNFGIPQGPQGPTGATGAAGLGNPMYDTEADFEAADVPLTVQVVSTAGYTAIGDKGGYYRKRISTPSPVETWHTQSNDGAYWEPMDNTEVDIRMFGAACDGTTDDIDAWTACLEFIPAEGGIIRFGKETAVSTTIILGNGTTGLLPSTRRGIRIIGDTSPNFPYEGVFTSTAAAMIKWIGATDGVVMDIKGPMRGFELENIMIDGGIVAGYGLRNTAASYGTIKNVSIQGCRLVAMDVLALGFTTGGVETAVTKVIHDNMYLFLPDVAGAIGIRCDGATVDLVGNVTYSVFNDIRIITSATVINYPLYIGITDSLMFDRLLILTTGTAVNQSNIIFDYSKANGFPYGNTFNLADVGWQTGHAFQIVNVGTQAQIDAAHDYNKFNNIPRGNDATYLTTVDGLMYDLPKRAAKAIKSVAITTTTTSDDLGTLKTLGLASEQMIRVNWVARTRAVSAGGGRLLTIVLNYDDAFATRADTLGTLDLDTSLAASRGSEVFMVSSGETVNVSTAMAGGSGTPSFDLDVNMELLN